MTQLPLTITVAGRAGPYDLDTEQLVAGLSGYVFEETVIVKLPDGSTATATEVGELELAELQPGRFALRGTVTVDDSIAAPDLAVRSDGENGV